MITQRARPLEWQSPAGAVVDERDRRLYLSVKRLFDFVVSLTLLVLLSPLFVLIAVCIRLDSPGPAFFRQTRVGQNRRRQDLGERTFMMFKFRTMTHNADPEAHRRYATSFIKNQVAGGNGSNPDDSPCYKLTTDCRITRVGRILRRTSLDELPQLINVLQGDMSLVGPRPAIPYEVQEYEEWHMRRLLAIPGMTGWWQVRGRSRVSFDDMVRMDIYYYEHQSLALDLKILVLTPWAVISGKGAA